MNNVIKFLVYLLVILLLVSWLITMGKSCSSDKSQPQQTMEVMQDRTDSASDMMEDMESPDFTEELESILDEEEGIVEEDNTKTATKPAAAVENSGIVEDEMPSAPQPEAKEAVKKTPPPSKPQATTSSGSGKFLVVAGSYIHPDNADRQSKKLIDKGYSAEVVSFELSEYHTVLGGRFDSYDAAQNTVDRLANDGVEAYVKRRTR